MTRDFVHMLFSTWFNVLQPETINFKAPSLVISWGIVIFVAVIVYFFGSLLREREYQNLQSDKWAKQAFFLGLFAIFMGMVPGWIVGRDILTGRFSDRIALPAMFGISIVLVSIITKFIQNRNHQLLTISILVGLAAGTQFRIANEYRWEWVEQRQFFWQLYWRAPSLVENTAVLSDGAIFTYTGDYPTAAAINVLYASKKGDLKQPFWFFEIDDNFLNKMDILFEGQPINGSIRNITFTGNGKDNIVIWYEYPDSCLWVLSEHEAQNTYLPELTVEAIKASNLSRINFDPNAASLPIKSVFGPEPEHGWCYYFQKADIAYLNKEWQMIVELGNQAEKLDIEPNNKFEMYPFIEAYARTGSWEQARKMTVYSFRGDKEVRDMFCQIWTDLEFTTPPDKDKDKSIEDVFKTLKCTR